MNVVWALRSFFSLSFCFSRQDELGLRQWLLKNIFTSYLKLTTFSGMPGLFSNLAFLFRILNLPSRGSASQGLPRSVKFLKSLLLINLLPIFSARPCDPIQWSGSPIPRLNKLPFSSCWCSGGHTLSRLGLFTDIGLFALRESLQWTEHSVCGSMKRSLPSPFRSDRIKSP